MTAQKKQCQNVYRLHEPVNKSNEASVGASGTNKAYLELSATNMKFRLVRELHTTVSVLKAIPTHHLTSLNHHYQLAYNYQSPTFIQEAFSQHIVLWYTADYVLTLHNSAES